MRENNAVSLREMLEQLSSARLSEMMRLELRKEAPDKNSVELILGILEDREAETPDEADAQTEMAWERYQNRIEEGILRPKPVRHWHWGWLASAVAVTVVVLLAVVPQRADARTIWEILDRWKDSILELFTSSEEVRDIENDFNPNNPGLQQLYDEAVEIGIENPLIPMWFEEAYELSLLQVMQNPTTNGVVAEFLAGTKLAVFNVDVYGEKPLHGYCGEEAYYKEYEREGTIYQITRNNDQWVAIWTKDNVEYFLTIDCQEDTLDRILTSIYGTGENK